MEKLENILQTVCEARRPANGSEPVPDGETVIVNGKKSKMDVDRIVGKDTNGSFTIDYFEKGDEHLWDGEDKSRNIKQVLSKIQAEEPFFILGHAGWGKSTIIKQCAKKMHRHVITVYLDKACKEDIGGIPVPISKKNGEHELKILMPGWAQYMYDNPQYDYLLFFDEMNQADPEVMNALMPIVLDNTICGMKFNMMVVGAAGNYRDENTATHDLSGPLRSRFEPIIIWKDNDDESWEDWCKYFQKKIDNEYKDKLNGRAQEVFDQIKTHASWFKNPREIETRIFDWMDKLLKKQGSSIKEGGVIDEDLIQDRLYALLVTDLKDENIGQLEQYKAGLKGKKEYKTFVEKTANIIYSVLVNEETKEQKRNKKSTLLQDDLIPDIASHFAVEYVNSDNVKQKGSGWVGVTDPKSGDPITDSDDEIYKIAACEDTFCGLLGFGPEELRRYKAVLGNKAFRFKTEKECIDALKKEIPEYKILTRKEAMAIPAIDAISREIDPDYDK